MWTFATVFLTPVLNQLPGMAYRDEPMLVQAFIPELAVEAFNVSVLLRVAKLDEAQVQSLAISPLFIEHLAGKCHVALPAAPAGSLRGVQVTRCRPRLPDIPW